MKGKTQSKESNAKRSATLKAKFASGELKRVISEEQRKDISDTLIAKNASGEIIPWAKGLTKETDSRIAKLAKNNTGKRASKETREKQSKAKLGKSTWLKGLTAETDVRVANKIKQGEATMAKNGTHKLIGQKNSTIIKNKLLAGAELPIGGTKNYSLVYDERLKHYCRSSWEQTFGHFLLDNDVAYEYEPKTFKLLLEDSSWVTYRPDFFIPSLNLFIELKGYVFLKDENGNDLKSSLFKEQIKEYDMLVIGEKLFNKLFNKKKITITFIELLEKYFYEEFSDTKEDIIL